VKNLRSVLEDINMHFVCLIIEVALALARCSPYPHSRQRDTKTPRILIMCHSGL